MLAFVNSDEPDTLAEVIKTRFEETHLAIPDTGMALFHGVHHSIKAPYFGIFDLQTNIEVMAMNQSKISIHRALLLLAPTDVDNDVAYLLGKISSSIIENKLYTTIYNSGNFAVVIELLRQIVTKSIREYGV